jgi:hypothetical protein
MNKISKNVYLSIIAILSIALCVSVTLNFSAKTEASVKKVKVSEKSATSGIIDDINGDFYGTIFAQVSEDNGTVTFTLRQNAGGGLFVNRYILIENVDVDNDMSMQ